MTDLQPLRNTLGKPKPPLAKRPMTISDNLSASTQAHEQLLALADDGINRIK
jgi:hypothetical protein